MENFRNFWKFKKKSKVMKIQFLYFSGCPNHEIARKNLMEAIDEARIKDYVIEEIEIKDDEDALKYRFPGSPTIRVNGVDVDPSYVDSGNYGLMCRVYRIGDNFYGAPTKEMIKDALEDASFYEGIKEVGGCC